MKTEGQNGIDALALIYPDFLKPFVAVHQLCDDDIERPVLLFLTAVEENYGATDLECAVLVWCLLKMASS